MNRNDEHREELIDLGVASEQTQGILGVGADELGQFDQAGMSDD